MVSVRCCKEYLLISLRFLPSENEMPVIISIIILLYNCYSASFPFCSSNSELIKSMEHLKSKP